MLPSLWTIYLEKYFIKKSLPTKLILVNVFRLLWKSSTDHHISRCFYQLTTDLLQTPQSLLLSADWFDIQILGWCLWFEAISIMGLRNVRARAASWRHFLWSLHDPNFTATFLAESFQGHYIVWPRQEIHVLPMNRTPESRRGRRDRFSFGVEATRNQNGK